MEKTADGKRPRGRAPCRKDREWLRGFRLALILAEEVGETTWRTGRVEVLDADGRVVFSSAFRDLGKVKRVVAGREERQP